MCCFSVFCPDGGFLATDSACLAELCNFRTARPEAVKFTDRDLSGESRRCDSGTCETSLSLSLCQLQLLELSQRLRVRESVSTLRLRRGQVDVEWVEPTRISLLICATRYRTPLP